jgi:hypothetical protein
LVLIFLPALKFILIKGVQQLQTGFFTNGKVQPGIVNPVIFYVLNKCSGKFLNLISKIISIFEPQNNFHVFVQIIINAQ